MAKKYDVVIAGAGHNSLCVAAYLAKAGVDVCLVEKNPYVGGGAVSRELAAPGFITDLCSVIHIFIQPNPIIQRDELGLLSKYGLKYLYPDTQTVVYFDDGTYFTICKPLDMMLESIAKFSQRDAEKYKEFHDSTLQSLDLVLSGLYSPAPPFGSFVSLMDQSDEGRKLLKGMMLSALDIIEDWFENEKVKIALTRWVSEVMVSPSTKGTGLIFFMMIPVMHKFGGGLPVGGAGVLSECLEKCVLDLGGTIKTSCSVKEFKMGNGECKGVVLDDGEEILASKAVVSSLNIKQVFPDMIQDASLPEGFVDRVKQLRFSDFQCFLQGLALHEPPAYVNDGKELNEVLCVEFAPSNLEDYLRYFHDLGFGLAPHNPFVSCLTLLDPTRAPENKHTLYLYDFAPYDLKDGGPSRWDEIREEYAEEMLHFLRQYTTNMGPENIIGQWLQSPLDLERHNPAFMHGDFAQLGSQLDQMIGNRPLSGWNYRTPVEKLFMCGPSTHPGCGVTGGGRAAVQVVMEDLGIDFEKVIA